MNKTDAIKHLQNGGVLGMPTDTVWGLLGSIEHKKAINTVSRLKKRPPNKSYILLAPKTHILNQYENKLQPIQKTFLEKLWPREVSVVLETVSDLPDYLPTKDDTQAWRVPSSKSLQMLTKVVGPVIAPSANPSGEKPALNEADFKAYFGDSVPIYTGSKQKSRETRPSTIIDITGGDPELIRPGIMNFSEIMDTYRTAEIAAWKNEND